VHISRRRVTIELRTDRHSRGGGREEMRGFHELSVGITTLK
jgi:hypothetical protein